MNDSVKSIRQGLGEAIDHARGKPVKAVIHEFRPVDVKCIRAKVGMSQPEFAAAVGISVATLRHWERGDRTPRGPALALLNAVARRPKAVLEALTG